jgi:uncharacterized protein YbjT (DUF2867 family)
MDSSVVPEADVKPERVREWVVEELRRLGRGATPSDRRFPLATTVVESGPEPVVAARAYYRTACSDWGSAWILALEVDGERLFAVYAGTDGDTGWLELFDGAGAPLATASLDGDGVTWEPTDVARARTHSGERPQTARAPRPRLVVLGASGGVGRQVVRQAHDHGYHVVAVTRPASTVELPPGVEHRAGDLTDGAFLREVLRGATAVVSALGLRMPGLAPWHRPEVPDLLTRITPVLVGAMRAEGVGRIVAVSAGGVGDSRSQVPAFFRAMIKTTALRHAYAELEVMERVLLESGLDVCLCRPGGLSDGRYTGKAQVVDHIGPTPISRADVAGWMLHALRTTPFAHRTAMIAV